MRVEFGLCGGKREDKFDGRYKFGVEEQSCDRTICGRQRGGALEFVGGAEECGLAFQLEQQHKQNRRQNV